MKSLIISLALALLTVGAVAQTASMTLPVNFDNVPGNASTTWPLQTTNDQKNQWHYDNSNFAGIPGPITITDISVRSAYPNAPVPIFSFPSVNISVGSAVTGYQVGQHSATFDSNTCSDFTLVRSGPWTGGPVPASGTGPATFFSMGPLTTPFVFDPSLGRDLIIQIEKCGTTLLGPEIDGEQGGTGSVGGNRYVNTTSCSSPVATNWNNEFVPIVKLDFIGGGAPTVCLPQFQVNQLWSSLTVNGAPDPGVSAPITTLLSNGAVASLDLSSTNVGSPWDVGYTVGVLSGSLSAAGFVTPGGQTVNIDLTDPSFTFLNGGTFTGNSFANASIPISAANVVFAGQLAVVNPGGADNIALSHANDVSFVPCQGTNFDNLAAGIVAPTGYLNASAGGGAWRVGSSTPTVGTGPTLAASGTNFSYVESSVPGGAWAVFDTCLFDTTQLSTFTLDFSLSRIGETTGLCCNGASGIGTLNILMDDGGTGTFTPLATYTGTDPAQSQGGTEWSTESIPFGGLLTGSGVVRFRFDYSTIPWTGDIAIDDLFVN